MRLTLANAVCLYGELVCFVSDLLLFVSSIDVEHTLISSACNHGMDIFHFMNVLVKVSLLIRIPMDNQEADCTASMLVID